MRYFLFLAVIFVFANGCDKDSEENSFYGDMIAVKACISYVNQNGIDLLNNDNTNSYTTIEVYQLKDDRKIRVDFHLASSSSTKLPNDYLGFLLDNDDAFYIKLNEQDIDTIYGEIEEFTDNGIYSMILTDIIYNGVRMTHEGDSTGVFTIIK